MVDDKKVDNNEEDVKKVDIFAGAMKKGKATGADPKVYLMWKKGTKGANAIAILRNKGYKVEDVVDILIQTSGLLDQ